MKQSRIYNWFGKIFEYDCFRLNKFILSKITISYKVWPEVFARGRLGTGPTGSAELLRLVKTGVDRFDRFFIKF